MTNGESHAVETTPESKPLQRLVAVVVPVVRLPLSPDEQISLRHLRRYLLGFDRYVIGLERLPEELSDFALRRFHRRYFRGRNGYNRLLLTKEFYEAFADYEYILIYQLDCLVFANNLEEWCRAGWDYVGAPWPKDLGDPAQGFSGVGNGGLSLRKVRSALAVLNSTWLVEDPKERGRKTGPRSRVVYERLNGRPRLLHMVQEAKTLLHRWGYHNNVRWLTRQAADTMFHEDKFWSLDAPKLVANFRIPAPQEALNFAFEAAPLYCYEAKARRLPFGCHAWSKFDRQFWEPFLLK